MEFTEKLNAGVSSLASTIKTGIDTCAAEGKILEQQKKIKQLTKEIGNLVVVKLDEGEEMSPEIMERYKAIVEIRDVIDELEKGKSNAGAPAAVCPKCGGKISDGMKFCGNCGADLTEAAAAVEE
jgi:NADH pyrophosphatase NudC (nudix superfamily)